MDGARLGRAAPDRAVGRDARRLDLRPRPGGAQSAAVGHEVLSRDVGIVAMSGRSPSRSTAARSRPATARRSGRSPTATASPSRISATRPRPATAPDGNCRACMVEIEGERVLAASCIRKPTPGMKVRRRHRPRAETRAAHGVRAAGRRPAGARDRARPRLEVLALGRQGRRQRQPLPGATEHPAPDVSHPAMAVHLDACIHCNLCVRACREVQVNDVIGMAGRGHGEKIVFDFDDPMGESTCVACGECVQACPTGALMPSVLLDETTPGAHRVRRPHGRQPLPVLRRRLPAHLSHQGRQDPLCRAAATARPTTTGSASRAGSASTTSTIPTG